MIRREILKEVLLDNRNEVVKHQVIPRSFQFEEFGNYVFVGIRRAGKSFLLYQRIQELLHNGHTWNEMLYVNFEDERLIGMTTADLNLILEVHAEMSTDRPMLFLDEIQNIDGWDKFVRRLADNKYRAYVTGSNAKMLSQDVATTLGGRYITVHVYPYDFIPLATSPTAVSTSASSPPPTRIWKRRSMKSVSGRICYTAYMTLK